MEEEVPEAEISSGDEAASSSGEAAAAPRKRPGSDDESKKVGAICEEHGLRDVYTGMTNVYNQAMVEPFRKMQSMPLKQAQLGPEAGPTKATRK